MKQTQKGNVAIIAIIIVIVAITAGVIGWLLASRNQAPVQQTVVTQPIPVAKTQPVAPVAQPATPDKFAGWQTYTDTLHGFELKYPADFVVRKEDDRSISILTKEQSVSEIPAPSYAYVNYDVASGKPSKGTSITFAGGTAVESGSKSDSGDYSTSYDISTTRGGFDFSVNFMNKTKSTLTENDKQIISSFKFTN